MLTTSVAVSSSSTWQQTEGDEKRSWVAAVAFASSVLLGASTTVACDSVPVTTKKTNVFDPCTFPSAEEYLSPNECEANSPAKVYQTITNNLEDPVDPMTVYAKMPIMTEMDGKKKSQQYHLQATSSTEERKNAFLAEQKASIVASIADSVPEMTSQEWEIEKATRKAKQHSGGLKLFSGNGNLALSLEICRHLGINLGKATVGRFADGEANVVVHENVRGKDCYVIQPTCPPVNDNIMELLLMVSTLRRASARRITVVIPYYGYARQDRKMQVSAKCFPM